MFLAKCKFLHKMHPTRAPLTLIRPLITDPNQFPDLCVAQQTNFVRPYAADGDRQHCRISCL